MRAEHYPIPNNVARAVPPKSIEQLSQEWDAISGFRHDQLSSHKDLTYFNVLLPSILRALDQCDASSALDAGVGVGASIGALLGKVDKLTCIDPSGKSIELAKQHHPQPSNCLAMTLEEYSLIRKGQHTVLVANMVLINTPDLRAFLNAAYTTLDTKGALIATLTHPCFWPEYRGYTETDWFEYGKEIFIESPFRISLEPESSFSTTHVHRPLEMYFKAMKEAGFSCDYISEPMPDCETMKLYPISWKAPRYLTMILRKISV